MRRSLTRVEIKTVQRRNGAEVILALGVKLAILITAPLGAAAVAVSGERLLKKAEANDEGEQ